MQSLTRAQAAIAAAYPHAARKRSPEPAAPRVFYTGAHLIPFTIGDIKRIEASNVYQHVSGEPAAVVSPVDATPDGRSGRLAALFDAHEDRLYRLARRLAASADEAGNLVQDTFLKAAKS